MRSLAWLVWHLPPMRSLAWLVWHLPAICRASRDEERDIRLHAADAGVSPEEYRRRQAEIEAEWARREFAK